MAQVNSVDYLHDFIYLLNLPKEMALVLLKSTIDCQKFFAGYYGRNRYVIDDLLDYREFKIENSTITLEDFLYMCYNSNMQQAFEKTFLQSFTLEEMSLIEKAIISGRVSLESLFFGFERNPNKNIMKYVL
jgi:hypothetical protein